MKATKGVSLSNLRWRDLAGICWRQRYVEKQLRRQGVDFRSTDPVRVRQAYSKMSAAEFAAINGRQAWANARTLRDSWAGLIPNRAVHAVDLGTGCGTSTQILASLLSPGSRLFGLEFAPSLAEVARRQIYWGEDGRPLEASIAVGSVVEPWLESPGQEIRCGSIDIINASGILGHHVDGTGIISVLAEVERVLAPGGSAALDVGPALSSRELTRLMQQRGFVRIRRTRGQPFDQTGQVVFCRRNERDSISS